MVRSLQFRFSSMTLWPKRFTRITLSPAMWKALAGNALSRPRSRTIWARKAPAIFPSFAPILCDMYTKSPVLVGTAHPPKWGPRWKCSINSELFVKPPDPKITAFLALMVHRRFLSQIASHPAISPLWLQIRRTIRCRRSRLIPCSLDQTLNWRINSWPLPCLLSDFLGFPYSQACSPDSRGQGGLTNLRAS